MRLFTGRSVRSFGLLAGLLLTLQPGVLAETGYTHPEDLRDDLRRLMVSYESSGENDGALARRARAAGERVAALDAAEMDALYRSLSGSEELRQAVARLSQNGAVDPGFDERDGGLPSVLVDPVYSALCGDLRTDAQMASDQLTVWEEMSQAAATAQNECDADAMSCAAAATANEAALMARFVYEATRLCNADIDSAELSAALATLLELEDQVAASGTDILDALAAHDTDIKDALASHDADVLAALASHDADVLAALAAHDGTVQALLQEILANQLMIMDNQAQLLQGQDEIKELLLTPPGRRLGWNNRPNGVGAGTLPGNGNNGNGN